jgi:hypothetical protein
MKNKILFAAIVFTTIYSYNANAQVNVQCNVNFQPAWGPSGYDNAAYYYIPDIDAYYDVAAQDYVYMDNGNWVTSAYLPERYSNCDLYSVHKVVINEPRPWLRYNTYRNEYGGYRGRHDQVAIRDYREQRNYQPERYVYSNRYEGVRQVWNGNREGRAYNQNNAYSQRRDNNYGANRNNAYGERRNNFEGRGRHS